MRFSRARYITLCQQSLATAVVLVVGLSAAGVKTLDIVPAPGSARTTGAGEPLAGGVLSPQPPVPAARQQPKATEVAAAPVTPKVHEIKVAPRRAAPARTAVGGPARGTKVLVAQSAPEKVSGYATVGVTWQGRSYTSQQLTVQVRTETSGVWSSWMTNSHDEEDGPDADSPENVRPGTDALVIGDVDRVQMRAEATAGNTPKDLELAVIDPGTGKQVTQRPAIDTATLPAPADAAPDAAPRAAASTSDAESTGAIGGEATYAVSLSAMKTTTQPYIYSRAQWGANEKIRDQSAPGYGTVKAGFIHHTVNANTYSADQVPALLRGIYAYHTQSKGWRDIGYNYLVDRFGRIWEGRYGGVTRAVIGAHTLGYNEVSFAMSAIGNFDITDPPQAVADAYARLFAWKLSLYDIRADATRVYVKDRYLHAINGHRDVGQTACPGRYLYARIPSIRAAAQVLQNKAQSGTPAPTPTPTPTPTPSPPPTSFVAPTQTPRAAVPQPSSVSFPRSTNMVGTSYPDIAIRQTSTGLIRLLPTEGQVGLGAPVSTTVDWAGKVNLLAAVGDVTGDGKGDIVARAVKANVLRVYRGDGAGHVNPVGLGASTSFQTADLIVGAGDWNRDGKNDLLVRTSSHGYLYLMKGIGNGTFASGVRLSSGWSSVTSTAPAGDLTGDGRPDLVAVTASGALYVVPQTSTGTLGPWVKKQSLGTTYDAVVGGGRDLSGDTPGDVYLRNAHGGATSIMTGRSDGTFGPTLGSFAGAAGLDRLSAGQMSGAAQPDLVGLDPSSTHLVVVPSNGRRNVSTSVATNVTLPGASQVFSVGDWNRDGKGDLISRQYAGDTLKLRLGQGNGRFALPVRMSKGWKTFRYIAPVGDVTGDGRPDLVAKTGTGRMTIFPGNGKTGFLAPTLAPSSMRTFNQIGSGTWKPGAMPGSAYISADGSFVPFVGSTAGDPSGYDWMIGPGDVDGDGRADVVAHDADGVLWLLPGGSTGLGTRRVMTTGLTGYNLGG